MKLTTIGMPVAERRLELSPHGEVVVRIGKPRKMRGYESYYCPFEIRWTDRSRISCAGGADPMQALYLALQMIGTRLYTSDASKAGKLTWFGRRNLGFPVPENALDVIPKDKPRKAIKRTGVRSSSRKKSSRG